MSRLGLYFGGSVDMWAFQVQIKYFIVSLPHDGIFWNLVDTLRLSKGSDSAFFQIFPMILRILAKFSGYISLYAIFLKNGSMDHVEIWPRALPNYCASIPVIIKKDLWWPKLLVGFGCPRLYLFQVLTRYIWSTARSYDGRTEFVHHFTWTFEDGRPTRKSGSGPGMM